jgi:hypothetical protein
MDMVSWLVLCPPPHQQKQKAIRYEEAILKPSLAVRQLMYYMQYDVSTYNQLKSRPINADRRQCTRIPIESHHTTYMVY